MDLMGMFFLYCKFINSMHDPKSIEITATE